MREITPLLPGLSRFGRGCGGLFRWCSLSSDAGGLALREIHIRLKMAARLASCIADTCQSELVRHRLADIIRFRLLMIACGYEDGVGADSLCSDPALKMALGGGSLLAIHHFAAGEPAGRPQPCCAWAGP